MNQKRYHLDVRDFGPIIQADIELRPLSVFIGPSNTGKSWMAILIYALHQFFAGPDKHIIESPSGIIDRLLVKGHDQEIKDTLGRELTDLFDYLFATDTNDRKTNVPSERSLIQLLKPNFDGNGERLKRELCRCFGTNTNEFKRRNGDTDPIVSIRQSSSGDREKYDFKYEFLPFTGSLKSNFSESFQFETEAEFEPEDLNDISDFLASALDRAKKAETGEGKLLKFLISLVVASFQNQLVGPFSHSAYYFPADRTGIMHAQNVVVSSLIESSSTTGLASLFPRNTPMLTGVIADFLNRLIRIGSISNNSEFDATHSMGLERRILQGEVGVERGEVTNHPNFTYQPYGWESGIPLTNASSMVSELAPIILYLRYIALPGSVLLVEEPESHLHPAMQVEFIRQLANLVRSGFRVIVTTHSEFLMEEIGNIVRRSSIDPKSRLKEISDSEVALDPGDLGVWFFKPQTSDTQLLGSIVEEVSLDESGLYQSGFDDVAMALHNDWANLSSEINQSD